MSKSLFIAWVVLSAGLAAEPVRRVTNVIDAYPKPSKDGAWILFQSNRSGSLQFYVCRPDGSELRQVGSFSFAVFGPVWSPDGRRIVFAGSPSGDAEIFVMNADGSNVVQLTRSPGLDSHPHWSSDGSRIVFNSARTTPDPSADFSNQYHEIFSMKPDGSDVRQHTRCRSVCTYGSLSPDLTKIVYRKVIAGPGFQWDLSLGESNSEIFVADADGRNERNLSNSAAFDGWPAWSPDGTRIAFASNRAGPARAGQIYLVKPDGTGLVRVTDGPSGFAQPAWSSDGSTLYAYQNWEGPGFEYGNIVEIDVNTP